METLVYPIEGISCQHCVKKVVSAMLEVEGVKEATISDDHAWLQLRGSNLPSSVFINEVLEELGDYSVSPVS